MKRWMKLTGGVAAVAALAGSASAFCGFYVAKADTKLFNKASKVVIAHDQDRTVLTMASDYHGDLKDFALVVPVPTFLEKDQIHVTEMKHIDHLDAYTAPRLVEYFDHNPCAPVAVMEKMAAAPAAARDMMSQERAKALGVTIEASYTVGEYDILILSAKESQGLETWLRENDYRIPAGASRILGSYLGQGMRFFVAKVNLEEQAKIGATYLRPIQVAYESPKFMLPVRLGTINADGPQELFVFILAKNGRVEATNYRTVRIPSDQELPEFVKDDFGRFYKAMFERQTQREDMRVLFLEYAWDMNWCDPCAADPLSRKELRELGVHWFEGDWDAEDLQQPLRVRPGGAPPPRPINPEPINVFVTRLHFKYTKDTFPEDLRFQETGDRENFQARYILRHPYKGRMDCPEAEGYRRSLRERQRREIETLASLTGWDAEEIRRRNGPPETDSDQPTPNSNKPKEKKWYQRLWDRD